MRKDKEDYSIEGVDFDSVFNRNELLVRKALKILLEDGDMSLSIKDIQDVFALTLNQFPPHYVQQGTVVLFSNVQKKQMYKAIKKNIDLVQKRPKV